MALVGTGTQPAVALAPSRLSFSPELTGQSSVATAVSLTNSGAAPLAISSISFSGADAGDFTEQNNCGSSVATGATCTINVSFKPASGGARSATLNVTDNAPASPQSVALTGTASDFTLGVASGSSNSATVTAGESASYKLSAGSVGNLSGSVSLACSGAPTAATCSIAAPAVSVGPGLVSQPIVVTVSTTARSGVLPHWPKLPPLGSWPLSTWWLIGLVSLTALTMLVPVRRAARQQGTVHPRPAPLPVLLVLLACLALSVPACGGGGSTATTTTPAGTPAGTYTVTVTGTYTSGSVTVTHSTSLTLTVQ
ncbi:MAG TPA: choice-of-anchor D domain-containing protein [Terriglobia bacterium]|nr:choice-of-anchor D domain-containing protein [Terriglobia bacterium]